MDNERFDDYANTIASLGSTKDKTTGLTYCRRAPLARQTLEALYAQSALVARIVDLKVQEAFRTGFKVDTGKDLDNRLLKSRLDELKVVSGIQQLVKWGNLYGGATLYLAVDDHRKEDTPISPSANKRLDRVIPFAAHECWPNEEDGSFNSATFREILNYTLAPSAITSGSKTIHASRIIPYEPIKLPRGTNNPMRFANNGWGPSIIERIWTELGWMGSMKQHSVAMMYNASLLFLKIADFRKTHKTKEGKAELKKLLEAMRQSLDSLGVAGIDAEDSFEVLQLASTGAHELIDRLDDTFAAATDMPREILRNESPAGLNAGELSGPQEIWFSKVGVFRVEDVNPMLDRVLTLVLPSVGCYADEWTIEWEPLWTESENAKVDRANKSALTDQIYWNLNVAETAEIRHQRLEEGDLGPLRIADDKDDAPAIDFSNEVAAYQQAALPAVDPTAPASVAPEKVADLAMNGAQIQSLLTIVQSVNEGAIPRDAAKGIIGAAFPSLLGREEAVLGSSGMSLPAPALGGAPGLAPSVPPQADAPGEPQEAAYAPPAGEVPEPPDVLAAALGVSAGQIKSMHRRGEIGGWKIGSRWRFLRSEILQASHRPKPEPQTEEAPDGESEAP